MGDSERRKEEKKEIGERIEEEEWKEYFMRLLSRSGIQDKGGRAEKKRG